MFKKWYRVKKFWYFKVILLPVGSSTPSFLWNWIYCVTNKNTQYFFPNFFPMPLMLYIYRFYSFFFIRSKVYSGKINISTKILEFAFNLVKEKYFSCVCTSINFITLFKYTNNKMTRWSTYFGTKNMFDGRIFGKWVFDQSLVFFLLLGKKTIYWVKVAYFVTIGTLNHTLNQLLYNSIILYRYHTISNLMHVTEDLNNGNISNMIV
jgi:hypothetical protein